MAVPTIVGYVTHNIGGTGEINFTLTPDATIQTGDWMLAFVGDVSSVPNTLTASGWTKLVDGVVTGTMGYSVLAKKRFTGETSYAFSYPSTRLNNAVLVWVRGVDDIAHWVVGALRNRSAISTTTTFDNEAPSVTTVNANNLILGISFERTTATETDVTSITNATKVVFAPDNGSSTTTVDVASATQATAGATPVITWVYPNTQAINGAAMQIAFPPLPPQVGPGPTYVGYSYMSIGQSNTAITVTPDGTIATGDWMVAVLTSTTGITTVVPPVGWTTLRSLLTTGTLYTAIYAKFRVVGETGYTWSLDTNGLTSSMALLWGAGADSLLSNWPIGQSGDRLTTGTSTTNVAPSVTTVHDNSLVLTVSTERTTANEAGIASISGAAEWFFGAQNGAMIQTIEVGYLLKATAGATGNVTVTYPNAQASGNGLALQIAIPLGGVSATNRVGVWSGTTENIAYATAWTGVTENVPSLEFNTGVGPTVSQLFAATNSVLIAHRGGDVNWPEMTTRAYKESAVIWGMDAIEISVQKSSDGVFVACHDATTLRVTGQNYTISSTPWSTLSTLVVMSANTDNPSQPSEPLVKLTDLLDLYGGKRVIFIEDKTYANQTAILNLMDSYGGPSWFVWKQDLGGTVYAGAVSRGYRTWGYVFDSGMSNFAAKQAQWTYVGLDYHTISSTLISAIALAGANRVVAHIIPDVTQRDRLLAMGVRGLLVANVRDCLPKI